MATIVFCLLTQLQLLQHPLFASVIWSIWKCCNLKLWQQVNEITSQVFERAVHMLKDKKVYLIYIKIFYG